MNEYHAADKPGPSQKTDDGRPKRLEGLFARLRGRHESPRPKSPAPATPKVCTVCNLFSHIASKSGGQEHVDLKLFNPLLDSGAGPRKCDIKIDNQSLIDLLQKRGSQQDSFDPWLGSGDLLDVDSPVLHSACADSVVPPLTINYGTISHWLRVCSRDHPDTCGASSKLDLHLYALDCHNLTIVSLKPGQSYVALSYVWGPSADPSAVSSSPGNRRRPNRLVESELPLTVKDAIQVATRLGLRFLWVDRYCIPQTNVEHKRQAILNMNQVYAGAELTIVALYGNSIHAGLPGVSVQARSGGTRQVALPRAQTISTLPHFTQVIRESIWATRAWTYQEARLSRRCLFFSKYQLYYSCHEETLSEAVHTGSSWSHQQSPLHTTGLLPSTFSSIDVYNAPGYFLDRLVYTQKTLTYPGDALDAFRGLLRQHPFITLWGVPVAKKGLDQDPCVGFAMGLLWQRRAQSDPSVIPGHRRPGFPTWSWTSVYSPVFQDDRYIPGTSLYEDFLSQYPPRNRDYRREWKPSFTVEIPPDETTLAALLAQTSGNILPERTVSLIIEGDIVRLRRRKDWSGPMFEFCNEDGSSMFGDGAVWPSTAHFDTPDGEKEFQKELAAGNFAQDALVVIGDSQDLVDEPGADRHMVMMLLNWVRVGVAERAGLVREYSNVLDVEYQRKIPRRHMKFELR